MSFRRENSPARRPQSGRSTPTPYSWQQNRNLIPSHPEPFYQPNYPPYPGAMPNMQQYPPPGYYPPSSSCYPPQHYPPPHYAPAPMFPVPSEMPPLLPDPLIQRQTQFTPSSITHRPLFQSPPGPKPPVPQKPKMMPKMTSSSEASGASQPDLPPSYEEVTKQSSSLQTHKEKKISEKNQVENKKNTQSVNQIAAPLHKTNSNKDTVTIPPSANSSRREREARSRDKLAKTQNYSSSSKKGGEISGLAIDIDHRWQLIEELLRDTSPAPKTKVDVRCLGIDVPGEDRSYDPLALKNFLEYCTSSQCRVTDLVLSHDKKSAVAVFDRNIDYDDLVQFICEPQNRFLNFDLEFEEVCESCVVIVFTGSGVNEEEFCQQLIAMFKEAHSSTKDKLQNQKIVEGSCILFFFRDASKGDIRYLLKRVRMKYPDVSIYPLYPYPEDEYMYVTKESYINYTSKEGEVQKLSSKDFSVLLTQVNMNNLDHLRKLMTLRKHTGGDNSAQLSTSSTQSQWLVAYSKPEVACEVVSRSPIVYSDQTIAHSSLCASVPLEDCGLAISQAISNYFLLLTGLRADWLRRGVIMYTCANYGKHMVSKVYLTSDPSMAVVMFSYMGDKKPDFANICRGLQTSNLRCVRAWRLKSVIQVAVSGITSKDAKTVNKAVEKWGKDNSTNVVHHSMAGQTTTYNFEHEKEVVKFLSQKVGDSMELLEKYIVTPIVPALSDVALYLESGTVVPAPISVAGLVKELGYSNDYFEYFTKVADGIQKQVRKVLKNVQAEYRRENGHLISPDSSQSVFPNWRGQVTAKITELFNSLKEMESCTIPSAQWHMIKMKIDPNLCVFDQPEGSRQVTLRALGTPSLVTAFEDQLKSDYTSNADVSVTLPLVDAEFLKYKGLQAMKFELYGCNITVNLGNEMGTAIIKGDDAEMISKLQERIVKYPESLSKRQITVNTAMWEFLDSRTSRAFGHINGILDEYGIRYRTTTAAGKSGDHKLVLLITESENKSRLNEAEKKLRDYIICEDSVVASMELWEKTTKQNIEMYMRRKKLPYHIVRPTGSTGKVQVVSVKPAQQDLIKMLFLKENVESAARGDGSTRPKTNSDGTCLTVTPLSAVELMSVRTSTPPIRKSGSRADLLDLTSGFSDLRVRRNSCSMVGGSSVGGSSVGGSSVFSSRTKNYSGSSHGNPAAGSQIRLIHNHQRIEYQFCQKFLKDILTDDFIDNCKFEYNYKEKVINITSEDEEDVSSAKEAIFSMIRNLKKFTKVIADEITDKKYFQDASDGHKVIVYVHECHQINDYKIGVCNVVACCYSIQCVKADAMVIAVTQQLQMRDSGVGTVLAIADCQAARSLRQRYTADQLDMIGSCQEVTSRSSSTLYDMYIVIVVDNKDQSSLRNGFRRALRRASELGLTSIVTNLIGSDMRGFVTKEQSAEIILQCVADLEKTELKNVYICENSQHKTKTLTDKMKSYGSGVDFKESKRPAVGKKILSVCSYTMRDGEEFLKACSSVLRN